MRRALALLALLGGTAAQTPTFSGSDTAFILLRSALVLLMIPGLAIFYGGLVRAGSVLNTMMMSFAAMGVASSPGSPWGTPWPSGPAGTP
ncbi:hypothetical protein [Deinococcus daejeonensis]|uniref:Ammonium transporter AmtB-like domain-containing protein n=1 Tax=Deinococcus daejeonensis TaxID=1007098 RepID=A0ABQ2J4Z4_9DEIO|nr:hypothetical protein [Deinococcus daejeonensis]GGN36927.1 hypothetical protein GCM10010842_18300 [Deinococcus daejeonensis]